MNREIMILTDSCCDLPQWYIDEQGIQIVPLTVIMNGVEKPDDLAKTQQYEAFYNAILEGAMPKTAQANVFEFREIFESCAKQEQPILYIGFSSALSGCVNSAQVAREEVLELYPEAQIAVVDSKSASMGQGLLVGYATKFAKEGKSLEEIVGWLEANKLRMHHWFTVGDLNHLFRGGRVSKTAATVGTLLQIKPILHVDEEGRLVPVEKSKGRKKSLKKLVEKMNDYIIEPEAQMICISHGNCTEEAEEVKQMILEALPVKDVMINYIGATIGAHAGPGTVSVFFMGHPR